MYTAASQKYLNTQVNQLKAITFPFWIIRLSSHVLKVPLCMLNFSVTDRNRFFNSWVVSKRDINNKLIKKHIYSKKYVPSGFTDRKPLCSHMLLLSERSTNHLCVTVYSISISTHYHYLGRSTPTFAVLDFVTSAGWFKVCWLAAFILCLFFSPPFFYFFYLLLFEFFLSLFHVS